MSRRRRKKVNPKKAAARLPAYMQDVAFTKFSARKERRAKERGTFGAAGPVRRIDPKTGEVIE